MYSISYCCSVTKLYSAENFSKPTKYDIECISQVVAQTRLGIIASSHSNITKQPEVPSGVQRVF